MEEEKKDICLDKPWEKMTPAEQVARYYGVKPKTRTPEEEQRWLEQREILRFYLEKDRQKRVESEE